MFGAFKKKKKKLGGGGGGIKIPMSFSEFYQTDRLKSGNGSDNVQLWARFVNVY